VRARGEPAGSGRHAALGRGESRVKAEPPSVEYCFRWCEIPIGPAEGDL
jgi:hypothetical protein